LLIPKRAWNEIISYTENKGLKGITNPYEDRDEILRVEMKDERVLLDMDTPKDYNTVLEWDPEDTVENRLLCFKGRLFLVRHGETELHKEKIFLGQTDVHLSEIGRKQAANVAKELNAWKLTDPLLISSDLSRARESAEIIRDNIELRHIPSENKSPINAEDPSQQKSTTTSNLDIIEEKAFRELNLGTWDGQYISKIKAERLEEYEKRGLNLLAYKSGYEGENFYDLQYRVMKRLGDYAKEYSTRDLIIVAHSGGIRIILCNLLGIPLEEMKDFFVPRGSLNVVSF
jgi:probable phosphoglycerate mutase